MKRRAEHEPGFVLHAYPYKETSLIVEVVSRRFGRVAANGARIDAEKHYAYEAERGPVESRRVDGDSVISGRTLLDMAADNYENSRTREEARRLMRALIAERLGGQALHTRAVLAELQDL